MVVCRERMWEERVFEIAVRGTSVIERLRGSGGGGGEVLWKGVSMWFPMLNICAEDDEVWIRYLRKGTQLTPGITYTISASLLQEVTQPHRVLTWCPRD